MSGLILVIEDEQDLVRTLSYNLNKDGYQVRTALTGEEGIAQTELAPTPDLILLDLMLPDMSGIDVCRHVRRT
ncbi:MAG: response regulator, partial [Myxococcota bacterium]